MDKPTPKPAIDSDRSREKRATSEIDYIEENSKKLECLVMREDAAVFVHPLLDEGFGKFITCNNVAVKRYGYTREELLQLTAPAITNPVDAVRHAMRLKRKTLRDKKHLITRSEHVTKSGRIIPVEIDATVIPHEGQELIVAVVHDLEERQNFEAKLAESESRFRSILEKSADPIYVAETNGKFIDVNQAACDFTGFNRNELLSMTISDVDPAAKEFDFENQWESVFRGENIILESSHRNKLGELVEVEVNIAAFIYDGRKALLGTARDISERKDRERRLKQSEYRFRALLQSVETLSVQGYYPDGTIFFWNSANEAIYGYSAEEAMGKNMVDLIIPEAMRLEVQQTIKRAGVDGEMPPAGELLLQKKDGSKVWVYSSHVSVKIGDQYELYCLDVDLTAIKEAERQKEIIMKDLVDAKETAEQANQAKSDFLALMSHELRTPLNPIIGFSTLMLENCKEEQRELLEIIISSSNRMQNLVRDILDFAKFEKGGERLSPSVYHIQTTCKAAKQDVIEIAKHLELKFENGFEHYLPIPEELEAEFDRDALLRVLDNLLTNACKYTDSGEVRLQVGMMDSNQNARSKKFVFQISDSGIGIDKTHLPKLFEPFHQVDTSYTRTHGGIGLGLAVCKKLMDLMGGQISVESEIGKGSTFKVEVEFPTFQKYNTSTHQRQTEQRTQIPKGINILVVENDYHSQQLVCHFLDMHGGTYEIANTGRQAVDRCCDKSFDLVLMDLAMPQLDGIAATNEIRTNDQSISKSATIIALTADSSHGARKKCMDVGMNDFLTKPIDTESLLKLILKCKPR